MRCAIFILCIGRTAARVWKWRIAFLLAHLSGLGPADDLTIFQKMHRHSSVHWWDILLTRRILEFQYWRDFKNSALDLWWLAHEKDLKNKTWIFYLPASLFLLFCCLPWIVIRFLFYFYMNGTYHDLYFFYSLSIRKIYRSIYLFVIQSHMFQQHFLYCKDL